MDGTRVRIKGYGHYFETYRKGDDGKWRPLGQRVSCTTR